MTLLEKSYDSITIKTTFKSDKFLEAAVKFLDKHYNIPRIEDKDLELTLHLKTLEGLDDIVNSLKTYSGSVVKIEIV